MIDIEISKRVPPKKRSQSMRRYIIHNLKVASFYETVGSTFYAPHLGKCDASPATRKGNKSDRRSPLVGGSNYSSQRREPSKSRGISQNETGESF